jgi:hypothetical protein
MIGTYGQVQNQSWQQEAARNYQQLNDLYGNGWAEGGFGGPGLQQMQQQNQLRMTDPQEYNRQLALRMSQMQGPQQQQISMPGAGNNNRSGASQFRTTIGTQRNPLASANNSYNPFSR